MWNAGEKVITNKGTQRIIAFVDEAGRVWAFAPNGQIERIVPVYDAWGGEHDSEMGLRPTRADIPRQVAA